MGRTKWPPTYTQYLNAVTTCTPGTIFFPLGVWLLFLKCRSKLIFKVPTYTRQVSTGFPPGLINALLDANADKKLENLDHERLKTPKTDCLVTECKEVLDYRLGLYSRFVDLENTGLGYSYCRCHLLSGVQGSTVDKRCNNISLMHTSYASPCSLTTLYRISLHYTFHSICMHCIKTFYNCVTVLPII